MFSQKMLAARRKKRSLCISKTGEDIPSYFLFFIFSEPVLRKVGPIFFTETNLSRVKSNKKKEKVKADSLQMKKTYSRLSPAQLPKEEEVPPPEDTPSYMRQDPPDDKSEHVPMQPKKAKQTTQNEHEQEWSLIDWLWEPQKSEPASTLRDAEASSVETTTQQSEEQETAVNSNDPKPTRAKLEEQIPKHAQLTTQPTQKQEISLEKPTEPAGVVAGDKQKPTEIKQTERVVKGTSLELLKGQEAEQSSTVTKRSTKTKNKKQSSKKKPTKGFLTPNCAAQGISLAMSTLKEPEIRGQRATTDADLKRKAKTIKDIMAMVEKEKELNRSSSVICAPSRADDIDFDDLSFNFFAWGSVDTAYDDATEGAETRDGYDESTVDESTVGAPNVGESTVGESTFGETSVWETGIPGFNFFSFGSNATHVHETRDDHDVSIDDESSIDESSIEDESTVDNSNDGSESVEWSSSSEEEEDDGEEENWEVVSEFELPKMQKNEEEMSVFSVVSSAVSSLLSSKDREKLLEKESSSKDKIEEDIEISTERVKEAVSVFKQHANRLGIDRSDLFSAVKRTDATIVTL